MLKSLTVSTFKGIEQVSLAVTIFLVVKQETKESLGTSRRWLNSLTAKWQKLICIADL
jgi:hypothetical protein